MGKAEKIIIYEDMAKAGQEREGIFKIDKTKPSPEERKRKLEAFVYEVLKEAEEKGLTVQEVQKVGERISRYVEIAEYNMKVNTKFNAPGCYLW